MTSLAFQAAPALAPAQGTGDQPFRLAAGGLIARRRPLDFSFDGRRHTGFEGDTLASALLANGVRLVGRSFKYHRPRGILAAGSEEPNALVELRGGAAASRTPARR
jgi:sarcosine oxidase subunit alpha